MVQKRQLPKNASVTEMQRDGRLHAPAAERNGAAISRVLIRFARQHGNALEIASGTGQHVALFAGALPGLIWQPSEVDAARRSSIDRWTGHLPNVKPACLLNATAPGWSVAHPDQSLILLVNLLHLISADETRTLLSEAALSLALGGRFFVYGPFLRNGAATSEGDARFDASLRAADPAIGYKDLAQVRQWLADAGLNEIATVDMPANNLTLISERPTETPDAKTT